MLFLLQLLIVAAIILLLVTKCEQEKLSAIEEGNSSNLKMVGYDIHISKPQKTDTGIL